LKRIAILLAMLVLVAAGCASQTAPSAEEAPESTPTATAEPTASPTVEATASEDASGSGEALADLIPDEVAGLTRTDIPGMEAMISSALASSGVEASDAEFAFASFGEGDLALIVTALRVPGLNEQSLQLLAGAMAGANTAGGSVEEVTVGGKSVLQMSGEGTPGAAYLYFAEDAVFTIIGEDPDLAAQLLAELP
jgi:hypothetical protein